MSRSPPKPATASRASLIKVYSVPLILFAGGIFYQLFVIPNSFPPSHYDVLGIKRYSSIEEVQAAYENLSSKWSSGVEVPRTIEFIKIRYAYEVLTNDVWKRNYDIYSIDEHIHLLEKVKKQYAEANFSSIVLPLIDAAVASDTEDHALKFITADDFKSLIQDDKPLLIQLYSFGSHACAQFFDVWKGIVSLLDGVARTAVVELGEVKLAAYLSERKSTGQPFFRNGLPSLVAFPPGCKSSDCLEQYGGELSIYEVTDWFATNLLHLPRILYHSKDSLGPNFLAKSSPHKVKVIFLSETGVRAAPFIRQIAKNYWSYATFAFVLWREEESSVWLNAFGVESAPAIIFLKDPGVKPVVHHGSVNSSLLQQLMEHNKQQELPQLMGENSMELGCDARGYSRAGYDTPMWYCAIVAGRLGMELNKMRQTARRVQEILSSDESSTTASVALRRKRLTFSWLDGEVQKKYCFFHINSESSYETCGERKDMSDVPRLFIVRYKRNNTKEDETKVKKSLIETWHGDFDPASQLVALYNGSDDTSEIIQWMSKILDDGDSRELPFYKAKCPDLLPQNSERISFGGTQSKLSTSFLMKVINRIRTGIHDRLRDPYIGPFLLLGSLITFSTIWLGRSQQARQTPSNQPNQTPTEDRNRPKRRKRDRNAPGGNPPPSVTDHEPKNAYQVPSLSDSDSD